MALTRYRHFWSSKLEAAPVRKAHATDLGNAEMVNSLIQDVDITGVLKSYSPPRFVREVRQVETGKYLNERILGRLQPEETNFSIVLPSDFESLYAYNQDYQFEIVEELHSNAAAGIRTVIDLVTGTMFDREWADFMQNAQDRDVTLRFILKEYTRDFYDVDPDNGNVSNKTSVIAIKAGLATGSGTFRTRGRTDVGIEATVDDDLVSMFGPNRSPRERGNTDPGRTPGTN